ncbi:WD40-repeat-containing domain protein [Suillus discolor]|uniref:WD40-repeat-containing domain protein n=1 Tax=Suillus discolor TaxID=1912936 RepID=A0A9P7JZ80_9AGAM|nr:WD40-repeat-containing domain protein [Suillus discolor]KAG2118201.1 WD40-repeat-containing domain protein [Suillus discolor]
MISGSDDKTIRRWDLREGKEIEEAREVYKNRIYGVRVSRDGRWVVTAGYSLGLKVSEVETGIVRTFHIGWITCFDISTDSTLVAGGSYDGTRIWSLDTGELVVGPFQFTDKGDPSPIALRLSQDSRKMAVSLNLGHLQVWDVEAQKLLVQKSSPSKHSGFVSPVFWTTKDKSIVAAFSFTDDALIRTIYELDASTLKTVGAPFKHTDGIYGLALSSDCILLASSSYRSIKLWAFESRQLLASFDVSGSPMTVVLSPDSRQLAHTTFDDSKIYVCNIPANILASIGLQELQSSNSKSERSRHAGLLNSNATPRPARRKLVVIPAVSPIPRPLPARDPDTRLRFLRKLFSPSFRTGAVHTDEPRDPLDFSATLPLPRALSKHGDDARHAPVPRTTQSSAINTSSNLKSRLHRLSTHASPAIVDVPLAPGRLRYAAAGARGPEDDLIRDEDYVPPSPNAGSRQGTVNSGQHGRSRFCFCL